MGDILTGCSKLGKEIADALGLKHCKKLEITISAIGVATVKAECYIDRDGLAFLAATLQEYRLVPNPQEVTTIGDKDASTNHERKRHGKKKI